MRTPAELKAQKKIADEQATLYKNQVEAKIAAENIRLKQQSAYYQENDDARKPQQDKVIEGAKKLFNGEQAGYDTWAAAMSTLMAHDFLLYEYLGEILPDERAKFFDRLAATGHKLGQITGLGATPISHQPILSFDVEFDAPGKMTIKNLRRHDKQEFTHAQVNGVHEAVYCQMMQLGCELNDEGVLLDAGGDKMTQDKYRTLMEQQDSAAQYVTGLIRRGEPLSPTETHESPAP